MTLDEMLEELPKGCDIGAKSTGKGYPGLHLDAIDGGIPISSADLGLGGLSGGHPAGDVTARRVTSLYDLMDNAPEIRAFSQKLGHVPIDTNPRRRAEVKAERKREALAERCIGHRSPEARRYRERSTVERVNGRLIWRAACEGRGPGKVMCHLMFGILALTVEQLMRLIL